MGNEYSYLYIDMDGGESKLDKDHFRITLTRSYYSSHFKLDTHSIEYIGEFAKFLYSNRSYYYIYLRLNDQSSSFFAYYVREEYHLVKEVQVYYSVYHPNSPVIICFVRNVRKQYYTMQYLVETGSSYGFPEHYIKEPQMDSWLVYENNICNRVKLLLEPDYYENYYLDISYPFSSYYCCKFTAKEGNTDEIFSVSIDVLFYYDNQIDYGFLNPFNGKYFDSISVYYYNSIALAVVLSDYADRYYFVRHDYYGYWWRRVDDADKWQIKTDLDKAWEDYSYIVDFIYILDRKVGYNNVNVYGQDSQNLNYTIFTHVPSSNTRPSKPRLLINGELIKLSQEKSYDHVDGVITYFLKNRDGLEDSTPFLIVIQENKGGFAHYDYYTKPSDDAQFWLTLFGGVEIDSALYEFKTTTSRRFHKLRNQVFSLLKKAINKPNTLIDHVTIRDGSSSTKPPDGALVRSADTSGYSGVISSGDWDHKLRPPPYPYIPSPKVYFRNPSRVYRDHLFYKSDYEIAHERYEASFPRLVYNLPPPFLRAPNFHDPLPSGTYGASRDKGKTSQEITDSVGTIITEKAKQNTHSPQEKDNSEFYYGYPYIDSTSGYSYVGYSKDYDSDDEEVSTKVKIAGGVATTALGAGALGGAGYYAGGVVSLMNWLV